MFRNTEDSTAQTAKFVPISKRHFLKTAAAITAGISQLHKQFPGRKLLMLEGERADPAALNASPPRTYAQLDYTFIHPISRQGPLRIPAEWEEIISSAGATLLELVPGFGQVPGWISLYIISL